MRRTTAILLLGLTCGGFVSCSRMDTAAPHAEKNQGTSEATLQNWIILSDTDVRDSPSLDDSDFNGLWQPSESDVGRVIQEARLHVEKLKKKASSDYDRKQIADILARWSRYYCQAIGHTKEGKKLIHLNSFINVLPREAWCDWRHRYIRCLPATGDGATFWRMEYDCEAREFLEFHPNGV
jgi:hypothetical protein